MSYYSSPHKAQILASLQCQGTSNNCGPFTTATVINALCGKNIQGAPLAQEMNSPAWRGPMLVIRRIPNWATLPWGMVDIFKQHGLRTGWRFLANEQDLKQGLQAGMVLMPVTGTWKPLASHVMTLLEWDGDNRRLGFANTQVAGHSLFWWGESQFLQRWQAMGRLLVWVNPG